MKDWLRNVFRQIFTDGSNEFICIFRVMAAIGLLSYLGLSVRNVLHTGTFDYVNFAIGFSTVCAVAVGSKIKDGTESGK